MAHLISVHLPRKEAEAPSTYLQSLHGKGWGTEEMKRMMTIVLMLLSMLFSGAISTQAADRCWATAYCKTGTTASGTITTAYRTVAGKREWFGRAIHIWLDDGDGIQKVENYLGRYIVEDTGGEPIRKGRVIDIYMPNKADCKQFGGRRIIYELER